MGGKDSTSRHSRIRLSSWYVLTTGRIYLLSVCLVTLARMPSCPAQKSALVNLSIHSVMQLHSSSKSDHFSISLYPHFLSSSPSNSSRINRLTKVSPERRTGSADNGFESLPKCFRCWLSKKPMILVSDAYYKIFRARFGLCLFSISGIQ